MKVQTNDLLREYYKRIKNEYPELSKEKIYNICKSGWEFLNEEMSNDNLSSVRFKNFGVFKVYINKAKKVLKFNKKTLKENIISKEKHDKIEKMLNKFINVEKEYKNNI